MPGTWSIQNSFSELRGKLSRSAHRLIAWQKRQLSSSFRIVITWGDEKKLENSLSLFLLDFEIAPNENLHNGKYLRDAFDIFREGLSFPVSKPEIKHCLQGPFLHF